MKRVHGLQSARKGFRAATAATALRGCGCVEEGSSRCHSPNRS